MENNLIGLRISQEVHSTTLCQYTRNKGSIYLESKNMFRINSEESRTMQLQGGHSIGEAVKSLEQCSCRVATQLEKL